MANTSLAPIELLFDSFTSIPNNQMTVTDSAGIVLFDNSHNEGEDQPSPPADYKLNLPLTVTFSGPDYDPVEIEVSRMGG